MRIRTFVLALAAPLLVLSCSSSSSNSSSGAASSDTTVTQPIGPAGGAIQVGGATVTFPPGAVAASTTVTISVDPAGPPANFTALSKLFKCEPSGTEFAKPVEMRMPFTDDGKGGSLFWSSGADPTFTDLGGRVDGTTVVATVQHFSSGFVGRPK